MDFACKTTNEKNDQCCGVPSNWVLRDDHGHSLLTQIGQLMDEQRVEVEVNGVKQMSGVKITKCRYVCSTFSDSSLQGFYTKTQAFESQSNHHHLSSFTDLSITSGSSSHAVRVFSRSLMYKNSWKYLSQMVSGLLSRYLENSGCVGMCVNMCKIPTQDFFTNEFGLPLTMTPSTLVSHLLRTLAEKCAVLVSSFLIRCVGPEISLIQHFFLQNQGMGGHLLRCDNCILCLCRF